MVDHNYHNNWTMHVSTEGKIYYYHTVSGITQWELPIMPDNWTEFE